MSTTTLENLGSRLASARGLLGEALQESREAALEHGSRGLDGARELGLEAWQGARRGGKAAERALAAHPWETLVLAGVAGIAIGWIVRYAWPARTARRVPAVAKRRSAANGARRKT
ncbi:MAG: hypothetical protein EOP90_03755 [Lysobacteraceae bacterium]|nr:MAG: hypothetical protein EOP90_03755 [Xanthomonadaceae bacterium]